MNPTSFAAVTTAYTHLPATPRIDITRYLGDTIMNWQTLIKLAR